MRSYGHAADGAGLGASDHVCWTYDDDAEFLHAGVTYLSEGYEAGQRLMYVSGRTVERMRADLAGFEPAAKLLETGGLALASLPGIDDASVPPVAEEQLARYAESTERALADGYTGLRVLADVTALVADPARRPDHLRWERLAERYMASHPMSAFCAYDRRSLCPESLTDVAAVHPLVHGPDGFAPFRLFSDGDRLAVAGCVDAFSSDRLYRLLAASRPARGSMRLDVSRLDFVDARGMYTLARVGYELAEDGGRLAIDGTSGVFQRAWRALSFDELSGIELTGVGT